MNVLAGAGKPVIGIVGGIGAGKSAVAAELAAMGCVLIDADRVGHEMLGRADARREIRQRWGDGVFGPDGNVDRKALAKRVFADPDELVALNGILHPLMRRRMAARIADAQADPSAAGVALDAAVLFEAGWDDLCTHTVFVSAPASQRFARVAATRGWTRAEWKKREKTQISLDTKAARCDSILENRTSASYLREQVRELFHRICPSGF